MLSVADALGLCRMDDRDGEENVWWHVVVRLSDVTGAVRVLQGRGDVVVGRPYATVAGEGTAVMLGSLACERVLRRWFRARLALALVRPWARLRQAKWRCATHSGGAGVGRWTARRRLAVVDIHARVCVRRNIARNARVALSVARSGAPG
ncbi:hypothetical protein CF642_39165, partial [Burkholderia pseudomallei]